MFWTSVQFSFRPRLLVPPLRYGGNGANQSKEPNDIGLRYYIYASGAMGHNLDTVFEPFVAAVAIEPCQWHSARAPSPPMIARQLWRPMVVAACP